MNTWHKIVGWLGKEEVLPLSAGISQTEIGNPLLKKFYLHLEDVLVGELTFSDNIWYFKYSDEFINKSDDFNLIVGFPDLNKVYSSHELWPFFKIRIPGLKQPRVKEILKEENIDSNNDVKLLERFGKRTISNPYELETCL